MELYVILYWCGIGAAGFALLFGIVLAARLFHRVFAPLWFIFPFLAVPPLFSLLRRPEFDSYLWRGLSVLCITMVVWSFAVGIRSLWEWLFYGKDFAPEDSTHRYSDSFSAHDFDEEASYEISFDEAVVIVLALEERRRALGYKPGWLYYQCRESAILLDALAYLRADGRVSDRDDTDQEQQRSRTERASNSSAAEEPPAHETLGVAIDASPDEIKAAYREQMKRYHPDRLQHFGPEFATLANERTKRIQGAYETLMAKAGGRV